MKKEKLEAQERLIKAKSWCLGIIYVIAIIGMVVTGVVCVCF